MKVNKLKSNEIDNALIKAFICCNIVFTIVENPFFIELLKTLCLGYDSPSRWKLSTELLERELIKVNLKVEKILNSTFNLTLVIDMWITSTGKSF